MAQVHMTEADVTRDFRVVLEKLQEGTEVIVEQDSRPVAVIRLPPRTGRLLSECIAMAEMHGSQVTLDEEFAKDLEEVINSHQYSWKPPSWD